MKNLIRRVAIVGAAALMAVGMLTAPASAQSITGADWRSNHTICDGCTVSRGNLVAMWQAMLVDSVPGLGDCSTWVDGVFGSHTKAATQVWQHSHGLDADGVVGPKTWAMAFSLLIFNHLEAGYYFYTYNGGASTTGFTNVWFRRSAITYQWDFAGGIASFVNTDYPGITPGSCIGIAS
jgi:hypothetical protein